MADDQYQYVKLPDGSYGKFPASANDDQIRAVLASQFPKEFAAAKAGPPPDARIGTASVPRGASSWLQSLEGDVKYGTGQTMPGRVLQKLGAKGIALGVNEDNPISKTILGPIHAAQGEVQSYQGAQSGDYGKQVGGALKTAGGVLDTANIPLAFAANAPGTAEAVMGKTIPSVMKEQAGQKFSEVMQAAGSQPVATDAAAEVVNRAKELQKAGATIPRVLSRFFTRINDPEAGPLTYKDARDVYSIATRLSADEQARMTPVVRAQLAKFVDTLGKSIQSTASSVGQGENYASAMAQYARGAQWGNSLKTALKYGVGVGGSMIVGDALARVLANRISR